MDEVKIGWAESEFDLNYAMRIAVKSFYPDSIDSENAQALETKWNLDDNLEPKFLLIAKYGNEIVGGLRTTPKTIMRGEQEFQALGIAEIFVRVDFQGLGIAGQLVDKLISSTLASKYDLLLGVARKGIDGFYLKKGFYGLGSYPSIRFSGIKQSSKFRKRDLAPLRFQPITLDNSLNDFYESSYRNVFGRTVRSEVDWDRIDLECKSSTRKSLGVFSNDQIYGYLILGNDSVLEVCLDESVDRERFICALSEHLSVDELKFEITRSHSLLSLDLGFDVSTISRECYYGGHILRISNMKSVIAKFFERERGTLKTLGPNTIDVHYRGEQYQINAKEETLCVLNQYSAPTRFSDLDHGLPTANYGLTRLLLGSYGEYLDVNSRRYGFSNESFYISKIDEF